LSILDKGYSIVYCDGKISNKISNFKENKDLTIRVTDGVIHSKVKEIKKN
jgi:exonuclease VII large subunit